MIQFTVFVGLACMALGTYILALKKKKVNDALDFFLDPACDMCLAGSAIFLLSFFGCTGALRENTVFLKIFYYSLSLFLLLEVAVAVLFFLSYYQDDVRNALFPEDTFRKAIVSYRSDRDMQDLIDSLQQSLGCCGMSDNEKGYEDWNANEYFNCTLGNQSPEKCSVPPSCCKMEAGAQINLNCGGNIYTWNNGQRTVSDTRKIYTKGCLMALGDWVNQNALILGGVLLGLAGIALTTVGTYILVLKDKKITYFVEFLFDPSCLMCLAGAVTVFAAFFGCGGALRENTLFLRIYYWVLSILLLLQVIVIIFVFIFYFMEDVAQKMNLYPEDVLNDAVRRYRSDVDMRNVIDNMQEFLGCCGVSNDNEGYKNWNDNEYFNCTSAKEGETVGAQCSVPHSCCKKEAGENINYQCGYGVLLKEDPSEVSDRIYTQGCLFAIKQLITDNAWIIGGIVIGILIPQALLICMAKTLYDQIQMQYSKW
nr:hypothetical protein BaRGS_018493 [Batillaria attramentaria]